MDHKFAAAMIFRRNLSTHGWRCGRNVNLSGKRWPQVIDSKWRPQRDTRRVGVLGLFKTRRMPINQVNPGSASSRGRFRCTSIDPVIPPEREKSRDDRSRKVPRHPTNDPRRRSSVNWYGRRAASRSFVGSWEWPGPVAVGRGADVGLAQPVPALARPLRQAHRRPRSVPLARVRDDLLAVVAQDVEDHLGGCPFSPAPIAKSPFSWGNRVHAATLGASGARPWESVYPWPLIASNPVRATVPPL
jgi:hypothetical protein